MRILITGVGGFVGGHLARHLCEAMPNAELHGTVLHNPGQAPANSVLHALDLRDETAVHALLAQIQPEVIYHLAAWAEVRDSFDRPWETLENNIRAQVHLLTGCIAHKIMPRILIVSSGEIYGGDQSPNHPTTEDAPFRPANPYSVSKVAQDMLGLQYAISHRLPIVRARPFNHIGPGQGLGFVVPDFAMQIARIEAGQQQPVIRVGHIDSERDFTDVRDIARAYHALIERGTSGEAYNVASGATLRIDTLLHKLLAMSDTTIQIESDHLLLQYTGVRKTWGDPAKLRAATGWQPLIPIDQTLRDVLQDCRSRVATGEMTAKRS